MRHRMKVHRPDDVEFEISLIATLKEWRELSEQLSIKRPSMNLANAITEVVLQAQKSFMPNDVEQK